LKQHFKFILSRYQGNRLLSVDILRGFTIFVMILVNNPGSWANIYSPLKHASWHGWTATDLVFPFFLFIVGLSISLSFSRPKVEQSSYREKLYNIFTRSFKLALLGLILALSYYNFYSVEFSWINDRLLKIRWFGVLQRIALVYLVCATLYVLISKNQRINYLSLGCLISLLSYWTLMILVSYQDSDGQHFQGLLITGNNLAAYIDHHLFSPTHLYHKNSLPFSSDPEGLLTSLPALATCLSGILVAETILKLQSYQLQIKWLFIIGAVCVVFAYLLNSVIPFNKNLWTPSYVFLSTGFAMILLGLCIYSVDYKKWKSAASPFIVFGANAIALYMLSGFAARLLSMIKIGSLTLKDYIYQFFQLVGNNENIHSLLFALFFMFMMYIPIFLMYKHKIFWKV
jgi:predicted acyltransferase